MKKIDNEMMMFESAFLKLHEYLKTNNYSGWEYDDMLASPLVRFLTGKFLYSKIAAVQLAKRSPINFRPLLGVPKLKSTKAYGFIVKGYLNYYLAEKNEQFLPTVRDALKWLIENRSRGYENCCWGNDFDFASRAGFFPRGLPTVVWTAHIQEAFDLAYQVTGYETYQKVVISCGDFVARDLEKSKDDSGHCIAYAPGIPSLVHNSNLLGAVALLRNWKYTKNKEYFHLAEEAVNWSESRINENGSWYYGDIPMLHWIDNYHTGYVLDCLCKCHELSEKQLVLPKTIKITYDFWKKNLFSENFAPKFYHNRVHPHDIQATAQAIESFARYSRYDKDAFEYAFGVAKWALENMQKKNGSFRYRIYRHCTNNLEPIHWGQGTMLSALGCLMYYANH